MATPQWFDLYDYDAKIERIGEGNGVFKLRLELPPARLQDLEDGEILDAGWVEDDPAPNGRRVLINQRTMFDTRSIGEAMGLFFSKDELREARAPQDTMRQEERLDGLAERRFIDEFELVEKIAMVDPTSRDRIMSSVAQAVLDQKKRLASERGNLLDGRGLELYEALVDGLVERQPKQTEREASEKALSLLRGFTSSSETVDPRASTEYDLSRRLLKALDAGDVQERDRVLDALMPHLDAQRGRFAFAEVGSGYEHSRPRDYALSRALLGGVVPVSMMGGFNVELNERNSIDSVLRRVPFAVVRDNSMPTRELANYAEAVVRATEYVADRLGLAPHDLIPDQETLPLRFNMGSVLAGSGAYGVVRSHQRKDGQEVSAEGDRQRGAITIAVSLRQPGAFVHELGHAIDRGNMLTASQREAVLERAGLLHRVQGQIGQHYSDDSEFGKYLRSAEEIFARVFESAMVNHALSKGDHELKSLGGMYTVNRADHFAARGELEATNEFLAGLSDELKAKRNRAYELAGEKSRDTRPRENAEPAEPIAPEANQEPAYAHQGFGLN